MRTLIAAAIATAVCAASVPALAQSVSRGTVFIQAERLTGFTHTRQTAGNVEGDVDHFSLLGTVPTGAYDIPRIGIDGLLTNHLSLGGFLIVDNRSGTADLAGFRGDGSAFGFGIGPRVGYVGMFSQKIGIWPRGGLSYFHESYDPGDGAAHYVAVDLEVPFIIGFVDGFGMIVGPTLDVSLDGERSVGNGSVDLSYTSFGLTAGLVGWL